MFGMVVMIRPYRVVAQPAPGTLREQPSRRSGKHVKRLAGSRIADVRIEAVHVRPHTSTLSDLENLPQRLARSCSPSGASRPRRRRSGRCFSRRGTGQAREVTGSLGLRGRVGAAAAAGRPRDDDGERRPADRRTAGRGALPCGGPRSPRPGGHLVFEIRDPARRAWEEWNREASYKVTEIPGAGAVESWAQVTEVNGPLVNSRWTYTSRRTGRS